MDLLFVSAGCVAGCAVSDSLASGGFYLVDPSCRGRGVGTELWQARLLYLADRNLGITAVPSRIEPNSRKGFAQVSFYVAEYEGVPIREKITTSDVPGVDVETFRASDMGNLTAYDAKIHTVPRERVISVWVSQAGATTLVARRGPHVVGYGCLLQLPGDRYSLSPVYADDPETGDMLLNKLLVLTPSQSVINLGIIENNAIGQQLVSTHQFHCSIRLARLYNKHDVSLPLQKVYAFSCPGVGLL